MLAETHNPDILTCLANLSSDEVFTSPNIANQILDSLPKDIWQDESTTFLDPVSKTGVFLREITKRLMTGLESKIPNIEERLQHILENQVFGIGITELTSLVTRRSVYLSKHADGKYTVNKFEDDQGNIKFWDINHTWKAYGAGRAGIKCTYCGVSKVYLRDQQSESYAYPFIHLDNPKEIFKMKFDVIIGNPPYQMADGGNGKSASPIYNKFIEQAKKLDPSYLIMIIPSRWYIGGKGLDQFRKDMLNDTKIKKIVDFEDSSDVFPGVDIAGGICYFLRDKFHTGDCEVVNHIDGNNKSSLRKLNEFDIFIRRKEAIDLINRMQTWADLNGIKSLSQSISARNPFGLNSNYKPSDAGIPCYFTQSTGKRFAKKEDVTKGESYLNKWKVLIPRAPIAGQTDFSKPIKFYHNKNVIIAEPGTCCTDSWIIAGTFDSQEEAHNFRSYLFTKTLRYLLLQSVISQDVTRENFRFVPALSPYKSQITDDDLRDLFQINPMEWAEIDARIQETS
tara:strand:+ start:545 stop:2071 length:1527 start_codon:yes stop_codon:yes gene_type:complete